MRIISGRLGGRKIEPPARMPYTRPTTDVAKTGLFNILRHRLDLDGIRTLDLFGGTGSISFELASEGATDLTVVEADAAMADFIRSTAARLGIAGLRVVREDVFRYLERFPGDDGMGEGFGFIFAGPPYALGNIDDLPRLVVSRRLLKSGGWFVLEHTPRNHYQNFPQYHSERSYGTTVFSFFLNP